MGNLLQICETCQKIHLVLSGSCESSRMIRIVTFDRLSGMTSLFDCSMLFFSLLNSPKLLLDRLYILFYPFFRPESFLALLRNSRICQVRKNNLLFRAKRVGWIVMNYLHPLSQWKNMIQMSQNLALDQLLLQHPAQLPQRVLQDLLENPVDPRYPLRPRSRRRHRPHNRYLSCHQDDLGQNLSSILKFLQDFIILSRSLLSY